MNYSNIPLQHARPGLAAPYIKLVVSVLIGAGLGVGMYYYLLNRNAAEIVGTGTAGSQALCACPHCGMTVNKPSKLDCEEINCPNCGSAMNNAATFIAAPTAPGGNNSGVPLTQNRRETLAEQGTVTPGRLGQNQRETLAEQNLLPGQTSPPMPPAAQQTKPPQSAAPQKPDITPRTAAVELVQPIDAQICICPNCGNRLEPQAGFSCTHMRCPVCNSAMTNSVFVGRPQDMKLVNLGTAPSAQAQPQAPAALLAQTPGTAPSPAPCPHAVAAQGQTPAPCPMHSLQPPATNSQAITYTADIKPIIERNCLRCHGGPIRSLKTYDQVKSYADNGLLKMMTQPGGPMSRFLTSDEAHQISMWIDSGAQP